MPSDSDPIDGRKRATPDNLAYVVVDMISGMQLKLLALTFIAFIMLMSDSFINRVLARFEGAVDVKCPTTWGTVLQGLFLILAMIIIDGLNRNKII